MNKIKRLIFTSIVTFLLIAVSFHFGFIVQGDNKKKHVAAMSAKGYELGCVHSFVEIYGKSNGKILFVCQKRAQGLYNQLMGIKTQQFELDKRGPL